MPSHLQPPAASYSAAAKMPAACSPHPTRQCAECHAPEHQIFVVWDWNGTLVNDRWVAVTALNKTLQYYGCKPIDDEFYLQHFGFPVRPFYEQCGLDFTKIDWDELCKIFHHAVYECRRADLRPDARAALEFVKAHGGQNAILSALREDLLKRDVAHYQLADLFSLVYGVDNLDGASKVQRGRELAAQINGATLYLIGDTLHDAQVAQAIGAKCILASGGHQAAERLRAAAPVEPSLLQAVERIFS